jgi:hypothetical protein
MTGQLDETVQQVAEVSTNRMLKDLWTLMNAHAAACILMI